MVEIGRFDAYCEYYAWTDGMFQSGRVEWKLDIRTSELASTLWCKLGVAHEASFVGAEPGKTSWGIMLEFFANSQMRMSTLQDYSWVKPEFRTVQTSHGVCLRLVLDCDARTLTLRLIPNSFVKIGGEICTICDINVSKPVIPSIAFRSRSSSAYASATLT